MNNPGVYHLFVYGSLRSGFKSPAYEYISRYFSLQTEALVHGNLYDLSSYPVGVPAEEENFIKGELYFANNSQEFSWAIAQLDDYEGVAVEKGETPLYKRELAQVICPDGKIIPAWVYWYNGNVEGQARIESGDLLDYLQKKS
jgi:gamma-glutamylcyclotransferase (GGCT)/AIG2-like uncharacterized protein YtfP